MLSDILAFLALSLTRGILAAGIVYLTGRLGLRLLGVEFESLWDEISCSGAAGLGIVSLVAFALGCAGVLRAFPLAAVLVLLVLASLRVRHPARAAVRPPEAEATLLRTALIVIMILAIPLLILPLYPPTAPDAITYHLPVARKFALSGAVLPTPEFRYAVFPQLGEMLFSGALLLGNDLTAQWMSFLALIVAACAVAALVRPLGGEGAGLWGAGLLLGNSAFLLLGSVALVDMMLTAFVTITLLSFERWRGGHGERWLTLAGLAAGLAAGTKYSALFFPPVLVGLVVAATGWRRSPIPLLRFLVPLAVTASPWYLYNLYHTGNPVWPFFSGTFGLRYWNETDIAAQTSDLISQYGSGKSMAAFVKLPWNLFVHPEMFHSDGSLSYLLVAGFPFALYAVARDPAARRMGFVAVAYTIFWFFTAQILRYLIPVVPVYCAIAASGAGMWFNRRIGRGILPLVSAVLAMLLFIPAVYLTLRIEGMDGFPPTTAAERDRYLTKRLPSYGAVSFLNGSAGRPFTLYSYHDPQMACFTNGEFRGDFFGPWRYSRIEPALNAREDTLLLSLHDLGADYLLIRDDSAGCLCREEWLSRRFVVPVYRSPDVALFRVTDVPLGASYGPELIAPGDTLQAVIFTQTGVHFAATGGRMYYSVCTGSAPAEYANAALEVSWHDERGRLLRTDQVAGTFLPEKSVLRLIATSPPHTASGSVVVSPSGTAFPLVAGVSVCEVRFVPAP